MSFEVKNALIDLNQKTPEYLLREIFHHGKLAVREHAEKELKELDPKRRTVRKLREMLELI
ncbi:MAG: hypothetical protein AB7N76_23390 [Planctomycetota bacterium]